MINEWNALNQLINGQAHDRCYLRTTEAVAENRPSRIANTNYWLTFSFFVFVLFFVGL